MLASPSMASSAWLGRMIRWPLQFIPRDAVVPILKGSLKGYRWIAGSSTHGAWLGSYEFQKQLLFARHVRPGGTVWDVGANVGFYTLLASVLVGERGHVTAFEPLPRNLAYLYRHLQINHRSNVTVVEKAVSDRDGKASFDEGKDPCLGRLKEGGLLEVETVRLDTYCHDVPPRFPSVIKIDIEGAEFRVLAASEEFLSRFMPMLFLATHGYDLNRSCCGLLERLGYQVQQLRPEADADGMYEVFARAKA